MGGINRTIVATIALGLISAVLLSDVSRAQVDDGGALDSATALVPIEPDEIPNRPETPRPATCPTTEPTTEPATQPAEQMEEAKDSVSQMIQRVKQPLCDRGISTELSLTAEWSKNLRGGVNTEGSDFLHLLDLTISIDTKKLINVEGGTVFLNFQQEHGESAVVDAGNLQDTSGLNAEGRTQLSEAWYEQKLFDEKIRIKAGKIDANGDFAIVQNAEDFIVIPAMTSNSLLPTYPDPALGLELFATPCKAFYAGAGVFDGALQEGVNTGENAPVTMFGAPADLYLIGEAGLMWKHEGKTGRLGVGVWHHTGTFEKFTGGSTDGATGFYLTLDQTLIRENPESDDDAQGLGLFVIYDHANESIIETDQDLAAGLAYTGLLPKRDEDVAGIGVMWAHLSDDAGFARNSETLVEAFYKVQVTPWFAIQPDLQYVIDPAFATHDALVGTLRLNLSF
jgi:porin